MKKFLQNIVKLKEDINNKRFPVRVTHFTDLEIRKLHLSTFSVSCDNLTFMKGGGR
jgi:hypothetical protein